MHSLLATFLRNNFPLLIRVILLMEKQSLNISRISATHVRYDLNSQVYEQRNIIFTISPS